MSKQNDKKRRATVEIEVRYAETDQMGIVHHSNYLVWFELARTRLCAESGRPYADIEASGHWLVVTGAHLRYRDSARYGTTVQVHAWVDWVASRALAFGYQVTDGERRICEGTTEHVWVDVESGRHCRIPEELVPSFLELAGQESLSRPPGSR